MILLGGTIAHSETGNNSAIPLQSSNSTIEALGLDLYFQYYCPGYRKATQSGIIHKNQSNFIIYRSVQR